MTASGTATAVRTLHAVLPGGVDDPAAPSGGNRYDRRLCQQLTAAGWAVRELAAGGTWPRPAPADRRALGDLLATIPDGAVVLLDGLVAGAVPELLEPASDRLRLVVLVHLPLADETGLAPADAAELAARERRTLHAAAAVVATSDWAARRLVERYAVAAELVHVAAPGVDPAAAAPGTDGASQLLCVAALIPRKGHDVLVEALARVADRSWDCLCVGPLDRVPDHVDRVRHSALAHGLGERFRLAGPRGGAELAASYAAADLVVLASHTETYGMVVTEALARGIPVLATAVAGLPEALGRAPDGTLPGLLVPPADPAALAAALRRWFDEPDLRERLRRSARLRGAALPGWDVTADAVGRVLTRVGGR